MNRKLCIGGCGQWILPKKGAECRKCRRMRVHAGLKRQLRVKRGTAPEYQRVHRHARKEQSSEQSS